MAWTVFFAGRVGRQLAHIGGGEITALGAVNLVGAWFATIILHAASSVHGTGRLRTLGGPSVEEFERHAEPPWQGQSRGF